MDLLRALKTILSGWLVALQLDTAAPTFPSWTTWTSAPVPAAANLLLLHEARSCTHDTQPTHSAQDHAALFNWIQSIVQPVCLQRKSIIPQTFLNNNPNQNKACPCASNTSNMHRPTWDASAGASVLLLLLTFLFPENVFLSKSTTSNIRYQAIHFLDVARPTYCGFSLPEVCKSSFQ